jgi:putative transposase
MKRRNPGWGCPRIAQQIALSFGVEIDKDVVRRILSVHYPPGSDSAGPSWFTFLGPMKDSLWSCDLFRCESATLRTFWVLVVMDQFTRRIVGFGVQCGNVDGPALCRMFQQAIRRQSLPKYLSTDNDPLYRFHQWQANLRVLDITKIKTVPGVPSSHPSPPGPCPRGQSTSPGPSLSSLPAQYTRPYVRIGIVGIAPQDPGILRRRLDRGAVTVIVARDLMS